VKNKLNLDQQWHWTPLFLESCIPSGAGGEVGCLSSDGKVLVVAKKRISEMAEEIAFFIFIVSLMMIS